MVVMHSLPPSRFELWCMSLVEKVVEEGGNGKEKRLMRISYTHILGSYSILGIPYSSVENTSSV